MSATILRQGDGKHHCELPDVYSVNYGALVRCDECGLVWKLVVDLDRWHFDGVPRSWQRSVRSYFLPRRRVYK